MGAAASALAGGMTDAMGIDDDNQVDELTAMEMEMMKGNIDSDAIQDTKIKIRVFINMDEDDDNELGIDLNNLFQRNDQDKPFYVDVSINTLLLSLALALNFRPLQLQRIDN
jgi:hypothetical protein